MERRKRVRQDLQLPLTIFEVNGTAAQWSGVTRNLSSGGGICFWADFSLPVGSKVRYLVTLAESFPPVKITCGGVVVRCALRANAGDAQGSFEMAMTMSRYRFWSESLDESRKDDSANDGSESNGVPMAPHSETGLFPVALERK